MFRQGKVVALLGMLGTFAAIAAQLPSNRYALILTDPPVAEKFQTKAAMAQAAANSYRQQIAAMQRSVRSQLEAKHVAVTAAVSTVMNAVFVVASQDRVAELAGIPGVKAVVPVRRYKRDLNRATQLLNGPAAWAALGGLSSAGSGIKIAILDSGIDQTHPAFQDSTLAVPSGYPICSGADCQFTSNKVIVARSYVKQLAAGSAGNPAADSRPDDYSARDRDGHGTAVASCAAANTNTGAVTFNGMAPKAYLGNYKIYGSPGVNDGTTDDVIIAALDDAVNDKMDIVSFSTGGPALTAPLATGAACGLTDPTAPCDLSASAFENAAKNGMIIIASAGNDGQSGLRTPTFGTAASPADAPSVVAVGATTNSHVFVDFVTVTGSGVPSNLQSIFAQSGDGPIVTTPVTAPVKDVTAISGDVLGCTAMAAGSLAGSIALIQRGTCPFVQKVQNAQDAGAVGVILYMADPSPVIPPGGLSGTTIPTVMISQASGLALKLLLQSNPGQTATINTQTEQDAATFNQLASFSSLGPSVGDYLVKPDVVAVGTDVYMAGERYDPMGALYSPNGYVVADGTSFAAPLTAGTAALVKQAHPSYTAAQVRSALVNTASQDVTTDDTGRSVGIRSIGAGKVDAGAAANATVTSEPATLSFGAITGAAAQTKQFTITNHGAGAVTLGVAASGAALTVSPQSLPLAPGASGTVTATVPAGVITAGAFSGLITLQGSGVTLRVPYVYYLGDGIPSNLIPISDGFDGTVNEPIPEGFIAFKLIDGTGLPIANAPVTWAPPSGVTLPHADTTTDANGIAGAQVTIGASTGSFTIPARAGGLTWQFTGRARVKPNIAAGGIVNGADFGPAVAPGSYVSIFGAGLSDGTAAADTVRLPLSIDLAIVSFDVPSAGISVPGHLTYVSPGQVNVQVPWELQGQSSAQVKVTIDFSNGNVVTLPLSDYAPAFFEVNGSVAALDLKYQLIGGSNPARRGQVVALYANGLGPVDHPPASGDPAPASPLAQTTGALPVVTIGGQPAAVSFSGLAPGFAGLYQLNVTVPANISAGTQPVTVAVGGKTSKASSIAVQ